MATCLGLYIEDNLIKYAKVSKSNDAVKVESFGIKFYEKLEEAIKQIVEETYSFKIPISINTTEEIYNKLEVFSLLSKKDMDGIIKTEFENICYDKEQNSNVFEQRYVIANSHVQSEKLKVIHISVLKTSIAQKKNQFSDYKVNNILPVGAIIPNLLKKENKNTRSIIVNIEKNTTITTIYNNIVSDITVLPIGSQNIIENISKKENSYLKAYEICKNSTIYTEADKDLQYEENEYLVDIMPVLFQIVTEVKKIVDGTLERIDNVYITGTGAVINNIDIYFQEYLQNTHCEILKPSFINNNSKLNIKDYIEVNSAISIGLQGLEKKNNVNFVKESALEKTMTFLKSDFSSSTISSSTKGINEFLDKFSRQYNVVFSTFALLVVFYILSVFLINKEYDNKLALASESINITNERIQNIEAHNSKFNSATSNYERLIRNIENINNANSEDKRYKNTIPNLLNNIMAVIPKGVQLSLIQNTTDTHIVITAMSPKYEQIAFFKTKLKTEGILENVVSDTGTMQGGYLTVTIEGELP